MNLKISLQKKLFNVVLQRSNFQSDKKSLSIYALRFLLDLGIGIRYQDNQGRTALHYAIQVGDNESAKLIAQYYEKIINMQNKDEKTPLHIAAEKGNKKIIKFLLRRGADINAKDNN